LYGGRGQAPSRSAPDNETGIPVGIPDRAKSGRLTTLRGALEALFRSRPLHDLLALAEANPRAHCAMLVPKSV
jgi:hypothetical protein